MTARLRHPNCSVVNKSQRISALLLGELVKEKKTWHSLFPMSEGDNKRGAADILG